MDSPQDVRVRLRLSYSYQLDNLRGLWELISLRMLYGRDLSLRMKWMLIRN